MKVFCNQSENLSVVIGSIVYEFPLKSVDNSQRLAQKASVDTDFMDMLRMVCTLKSRMYDRSEMERQDSPNMKIFEKPVDRVLGF